MKKLMALAAVGEAATGLGLLLVPSLVAGLLFGEELTGAGALFGRITGIALIGLGVACWPGPPLAGMLIYSAIAALYLTCIGVTGGMTGVLLWPAVILHLTLTALLAWGSTRLRRQPEHDH